MTSSNDNYDFHDQIGHLLRRAYQRHVAIFQEAIPDSDLTAAQFVTLCAVREHKTCSLNEIVKTTAIDQATIRGVVDRLKTRGLVAVSADPSDGRKLLVRATSPGTDADRSYRALRQGCHRTDLWGVESGRARGVDVSAPQDDGFRSGIKDSREP
jgi:DNA-binding MarR family transcriptional regulator